MKLILHNLKDNIYNTLYPFWHNKFNLFMFANAFLLNIILWVLLYLKIKPNEYPIPLHFDIYFGVDVVDKWYKIFLVPLAGLGILVVNLFLSILIYKREKLASYFLLTAGFIIQVFLIMAGISLIFINR